MPDTNYGFARSAIGVCLTAIAALGCASALAPVDDGPVEIIAERHMFACGKWSPGAPGVRRTVFDIGLWQESSSTAPERALVDLIRRAGGRIVREFHGPMIRVELDIASVPALWGTTRRLELRRNR